MINDKSINELEGLIKTLGGVQQQAKNTFNSLITPELKGKMSDEQKEMFNELKQSVNLDGCNDLGEKLKEIQSTLNKYNEHL